MKVGWYRWVPFLGFHHVLMIMGIISILFWAVLLAGCTSTNGLKNIYLMSISYDTTVSNTTTGSLVADNGLSQSLANQLATSNNTLRELRIGYLFICIRLNNGAEVCSQNQNELAAVMESSAGSDPFNLLQLAQTIQSDIFFYPLIIVAIILTFIIVLLLSTFPGWHEEEGDEEDSVVEVKPFPSRPISMIALVALGLACALSCVSAFWQHIGASTASTVTRHLTDGLAVAHTGGAAMAFGWIAATFVMIAVLGIALMILSIRVLSALAD